MLAVPIFHVNGEDVEVVMAVAQIAQNGQTFQQDVVIDMYCFRKWGHNEGDEPLHNHWMLSESIQRPNGYAERMMKIIKTLLEKVNEVLADSASTGTAFQNETITVIHIYRLVQPQRNRC